MYYGYLQMIQFLTRDCELFRIKTTKMEDWDTRWQREGEAWYLWRCLIDLSSIILLVSSLTTRWIYAVEVLDLKKGQFQHWNKKN